jgi:hypothetical protein
MNDCWRLRTFANTPEKKKRDKGLGPLTPGFLPCAAAFFKRERFKDSKIQRFKDSKIQRFKV